MIICLISPVHCYFRDKICDFYHNYRIYELKIFWPILTTPQEFKNRSVYFKTEEWSITLLTFQAKISAWCAAEVSQGQITEWISCLFYTFSALRYIFKAVCNKRIFGNATSLASSTEPSKCVIADIKLDICWRLNPFLRAPWRTGSNNGKEMGRTSLGCSRLP